jgi:phage host-nuclease inhibitor protein Gam
MSLPLPKITDWNDVNQALARLAELHRDFAALETRRDQLIDEAKAEFLRDGGKLLPEITELGERVKGFVDAHPQDLDGRSKKLEHGIVAYRWASKLSIASRRVKSAVEWLLENKKAKYLHVEHKLNKEALREAPADVLKAIGARVTRNESFRYEITEGSFVVEDE